MMQGIEAIQSKTEKTLFDAVARMSKEYDIPLKKTRIKISCHSDRPEACYQIINGGNVIEETTLKKILGIGLIDLMGEEQLVSSFMNVALGVIAEELEIPIELANIRIYTRDGETPALAMLQEDVFKKNLTAEDIINTYMKYVEMMQKEQQETGTSDETSEGSGNAQLE